DRAAVVELDPRRALDLGEQQIGRVLQPGNLQSAARDLAVLDLTAVVIGHELAAADLAIGRALVGQADRILLVAAHEQVRGPAIDRDVVDVGLRARSLQHRLVIAGDETVGLAEARYPQRRKILLEEGFGAGVVGRLERFGDAAGFAQRGAQSLRFGSAGLRADRTAA